MRVANQVAANCGARPDRAKSDILLEAPANKLIAWLSALELGHAAAVSPEQQLALQPTHDQMQRDADQRQHE